MQIFIICPQTCPEKLEIWQAGRETPSGRYYEKNQKLLLDIFYLHFGMFLSLFFLVVPSKYITTKHVINLEANGTRNLLYQGNPSKTLNLIKICYSPFPLKTAQCLSFSS
jgi:hypothetical protein